ncbi:MAG: hypothetical protein EXR77_18490 [Myxococcales bacterium]|nr:hypothetical protein [Myxococcales bacterium]
MRKSRSRRTQKNVRRLTPGHVFCYRSGRPVTSYRHLDGTEGTRLPSHFLQPAGEGEFIEAFREAFLRSVRLRLRSDVSVGVSLSGGLDSTAVMCAAARQLDGERTRACRYAFTALIPEYDETDFIAPVIAQTGARWHSTVASDEHLSERCSEFFRVHDEPVHSLTPLAGFLVMGLARSAGVKVLLNGQGADELVAGYDTSILPFLRSVTAEDGVVAALRQSVAESSSANEAIGLMGRAQGAMAAKLVAPAFEDQWRRYAAQRQARGKPKLLNDDGPIGGAPMLKRAQSGSLRLALDSQMRRTPLPLYLRIEDATASAFSLETRLPFLDPDVIGIAQQAPARLLRRAGLNKFLLRSILPGLVPDVVWQRRDKMGFPVPHARWLSGPLRPLLLDTLSEARLRARGWYNVPAVVVARDTLLANPTATVPAATLRLFLLERWAQDHLDSNW